MVGEKRGGTTTEVAILQIATTTERRSSRTANQLKRRFQQRLEEQPQLVTSACSSEVDRKLKRDTKPKLLNRNSYGIEICCKCWCWRSQRLTGGESETLKLRLRLQSHLIILRKKMVNIAYYQKMDHTEKTCRTINVRVLC